MASDSRSSGGGGGAGILVFVVLGMSILGPFLLLFVVIAWLVAESALANASPGGRGFRLTSDEYFRAKGLLNRLIAVHGPRDRPVDTEDVRALVHDEYASAGLQEVLEGPRRRFEAWRSPHKWAWGTRVGMLTAVIVCVPGYSLLVGLNDQARAASIRPFDAWFMVLLASGVGCLMVGLVAWLVGTIASIVAQIGQERHAPPDRWSLLVLAAEEFEEGDAPEAHPVEVEVIDQRANHAR